MRTSIRDRKAVITRLLGVGVSFDHACALRRISMTLHRWDELECGDGNGCIERDEDTGKTYWLNANTGRRWPTPDKETGALKRLAKIGTAYPDLRFYHQSDCRGVALYVVRAMDLQGDSIESNYTRGFPVY